MVDDCYYFLYSKCRDPSKCQYRHSYSAKENPITCETWAKKKNCTLSCPYRHSLYHESKARHNEYCYWESKGGCKKEFCEFKHINAKKDDWKRTKIQSLDELKEQKKKLENLKTQYEEQKVQISNNDVTSLEEKLKEIDNIL
ncbi:hypothetical protein H311_04451, partial [Anncaliia algerae PRA109]